MENFYGYRDTIQVGAQHSFSQTHNFKIINRVVFYSLSEESTVISFFFELNEPPVTYFRGFEGSDCLTDSDNKIPRDLT